MARRMHSRSLLFFEKQIDIANDPVFLIVENCKSYNSIILNTAGSGNPENAWYVEIPIIPGNPLELEQNVEWLLEVYLEGDNLEIILVENGNKGSINGLVIWGVK